MLTYGKQPWFEYNNLEVIQNVTRGRQLTAPDNCPPALVELMQACWQFNPTDRIPIAKVHLRLQHLMEQHRNGLLPLAADSSTSNGSNSSTTGGNDQQSREPSVPRKKKAAISPPAKENSTVSPALLPTDPLPPSGPSSPEELPVSSCTATGDKSSTDSAEPYLELSH